jgi:hypothetical protein
VPHLFTHSLVHQSTSLELQLDKKEERERRTTWERNFYSVWFILLALYWLSILRKFLLDFLPREGFPG